MFNRFFSHCRRFQLNRSPVFLRADRKGKESTAPINCFEKRSYRFPSRQLLYLKHGKKMHA
jgi:hypothetical protein